MPTLDSTRPSTARSPRWRQAAVLVALAAALAWVALPGALRFGADPTPATLDALPLVTLQGAPAALVRHAAGRPLVINLWASWCPPCRHEMPLLAAVQQARRDVAFAFANQGEDVLAAEHYLAESGLALDGVLLDPGKAIGRAAGSRALPITLFFDAGGRLVRTHVGALTPASLDAALRRAAPPKVN
jgi:thiol-disulfide isomerase/thioredoxin